MNTLPLVTHVQLVQKIIGNLRKQGAHSIANVLSRAQHFEIDLDIYVAAGKFAFHMFMDSEFFVDSIALPPANPASFRIGDEPSLYLMRRVGNDVIVEQMSVDGSIYRQFSWEPGSNRIAARSSFEAETNETVFRLHLTAAALGMTLSLLNSPKLVKTGASSQRQERRAANRVHQLPVDAWHRVRWRTAAGNEAEQTDAADSETRMPLHYRRGHLRTAQSHFVGAFETVQTDTGWGQWIDGRWVGHPAFGIKKSIYAPALDEKGLAEFMRRQKARRTTIST